MASPRSVLKLREDELGITPAAGTWLPVPIENFNPRGSQKRGAPKNITGDGMNREHPVERWELSATKNAGFLSGNPAYTELREEACQHPVLPAINLTANDISAVAAGNKLVKLSGWPADVKRGAVVMVRGFDDAQNGAEFVALVKTVNGNDCELDDRVKTLVDEAAGSDITLHRARQFQLGEPRVVVGSTFHVFNTASARGNVWSGMTPRSWSVTFPESGSVTENFQFSMMGAPQKTNALPGDIATLPKIKEVRGGFSVFDPVHPETGLGFNYNGALLSDAIFPSLKFELTNPVLERRGVGGQGLPQDLAPEGSISMKLDIEVLMGTADAQEIEDRARDVNTEDFISFGYRDPLGKMGYFLFPFLEPQDEEQGTVQSTGDEMMKLSFMAGYAEELGSYFAYAEFDPVP